MMKSYTYYDEVVETMPRAALERLQEERLMRLIPYVYERSPLVKQLWKKAGITPKDIRSLADFRAKAPFATKAALQGFRDEFRDPACGLICAGAPRLRGIGFTSGTTGDPTAMPRGDTYISDVLLRRDFWHMGARPGDFISLVHFTFRKGQHGDKFVGAGLKPICFAHASHELPRFLEASTQLRPTVLHQLSTPLVLALEKLIGQTGIDARDVFSSYKGAVFGGEPLSPRLKNLLASWGLEIYEYTAVGDVQGAMECSMHDGVHVWEDNAMVEFLDPQGTQPAANGTRGELVVTALTDDIAPLIRYRSEDLVSFERETCKCGRTHVRFEPLGRASDEMLVQGRSVLPRDIMEVVELELETRAGLFQIIRPDRSTDVLRVRVGYDPSLLTSSETELAGRLQERIQARLDVPTAIELCDNTELLKQGPPHKIPRVTRQ